MAIAHRVFWMARRGNAPEEYDDACAANEKAGRFAVADGASESGFAKSWAELLVQDFVHPSDRPLDQWPRRLPALQQQWQTEVGAKDLPWYAKAKFQQGAYATFLGLVLTPAADGSADWQAVAVGDTCLFHCRGTTLLRAFPLEKSSQFNNYPKLVGSRTPPEHVREKLIQYSHGHAAPGDRLWLMTDALAECALARHEAGEAPWDELASLWDRPEGEGDDKRFEEWITGLRDARRLRNDDVTLLVVNCGTTT